ncbi:unnamed protein product, partial [marine sediment metagenome]
PTPIFEIKEFNATGIVILRSEFINITARNSSFQVLIKQKLKIAESPANSSNILCVQMINKMIKFLDFGEGAAIGVLIIIIMCIYVIIYLKIVSRKELTF